MNAQSKIGYIERITLPGLTVSCDAKVDTGACTSSLHAEKIEVFTKNEQKWVRFHVLFHNESAQIDQVCEALVFDHRVIVSSNGHRNERFIIKTDIQLGKSCWPIEVSLSSRGTMKYPMLLGRKAISGRFVVDVSENYLGSSS